MWSLGESFDDGIAPCRVQGKRRVGLPSVIRDISHNVLKLLAICLCDSLDLASGQERATSRILASDHVMPQTQHQTANNQGWIHRGLIQKGRNRTPRPTHPCIETIHMQENALAPIAGCFWLQRDHLLDRRLEVCLGPREQSHVCASPCKLHGHIFADSAQATA